MPTECDGRCSSKETVFMSISLSLSVPTAAALEKMSVIDSPENGDTGISSETPSEETLSKAAESGESSS